MAANNNKSNPGGNPGQGNGGSPFRHDSNQGNWHDGDGFSIGGGNENQVLAVNGYADASVDIGLQATAPSDSASIDISLGNTVNLNAFGGVAASATVTSAAAGQGSLTLTNGNLSGTYTASFSIEVTAYLPADNATVSMQITDSFQLSVTGTGYAGVTLADTAASGGTVEASTPARSGAGGPGGNAAGNHGNTFDLARFAASVLNTGQWNIAFVSSAPGESLAGMGTSVLTINAMADVPGNRGPEVLNFHDTERTNLAFSDRSSPPAGGQYGLDASVSAPVALFHSA
jgi:hypothetical protein